ncbi:signal transduction histidine kinase [Glycocaulis alkaliphilus]|uniref:histidine kinase n=2 Tax=Glycocaulis alkaliphilus TaxID=1434191 RepID=A0A3T0E8R3_9PROT|nr:signal transduction histidine kinase [Glycocaulis alkaliphilus]GGB74688.1 histidine kinase [Glycocaulis alkaliphilus]
MLAVIILALIPILTLSGLYAQSRFETARDNQRELLAARAQLTAQSQRQLIMGAGSMMSALAQQAPVRLGGALCARSLAQALADQPAYATLVRVNARGVVACSAEPLSDTVRFDEAAWFAEARDSGRFIVGALEIDPITNQAVIRAVSPVFEPDGSFTGALATGIRLSALEDLGRERAGEARSALVDREGRVLTQSRDMGLARIDAELMAEAADTGSARFAGTGPDGAPRQFVLVPLVSAELYALLAETAPEFLEFTLVDITGTLLLPVLMLVLAGSVIWIATDVMILRWLRYLRRVAMAYGKGRYSVRPHRALRAPGELRELAAGFDTMARSVAERDEALTRSLAYQEMLLKEVHHRVKNNLQIITSLINLQMRSVDDPRAAKVLGDAQSRINALALVHRSLYEAGDFAKINLKPFFEELCSLTHAAVGGEERTLDLVTQIEPVHLGAERCIPLALFVTEAMTNAYKHAFEGRDSGTLTVSVSIDDMRRLTARIADNGVGAASAPEPGRKGVGGALFSAFARQLGGISETGVQPDGGHSVAITFPLLEDEGVPES